MNRFQNKIVMGGSDIESESDDEYMPGPEIMYQQYMYNANMHNAMMHNMMPCIPMPCVPPYCYPVPYPSMLPNYPVNHAMAAGLHYENGGSRSRRHKRKSWSKGDENAKYNSHHRQHRVVSRQRYYPSSSESDSDDERPDTREKRVPACRSVSREIIADKSNHTLSHSSPMPPSSGVEPHRSNNMTSSDFVPSTPLQSTTVKSVPKVDNAVDLNTVRSNTTVTHHSHSQLNNRTDSTQPASIENKCYVTAGSAAFLQKLPFNHPSIENSVMVVNICQQEEPTPAVTNDGSVDIFAANDSVRLKNVATHDVTKSTDVVPSIDPSTSSASCESKQVYSNHRTATQIEVPSALHVTSPDRTQTLLEMTSYAKSQSIIFEGGGQLAPSTAQNDSNVDVGITKPSLQSSSNMAVQMLHPVKGDSSTSVRLSNPDKDPIWRNATNSLKYLQSLHSLRKTWLEWETKYRPPPVSIYNLRGADPYNV